MNITQDFWMLKPAIVDLTEDEPNTSPSPSPIHSNEPQTTPSPKLTKMKMIHSKISNFNGSINVPRSFMKFNQPQKSIKRGYHLNGKNDENNNEFPKTPKINYSNCNNGKNHKLKFKLKKKKSKLKTKNMHKNKKFNPLKKWLLLCEESKKLCNENHLNQDKTKYCGNMNGLNNLKANLTDDQRKIENEKNKKKQNQTKEMEEKDEKDNNEQNETNDVKQNQPKLRNLNGENGPFNKLCKNNKDDDLKGMNKNNHLNDTKKKNFNNINGLNNGLCSNKNIKTNLNNMNEETDDKTQQNQEYDVNENQLKLINENNKNAPFNKLCTTNKHNDLKGTKNEENLDDTKTKNFENVNGLNNGLCSNENTRTNLNNMNEDDDNTHVKEHDVSQNQSKLINEQSENALFNKLCTNNEHNDLKKLNNENHSDETKLKYFDNTNGANNRLCSNENLNTNLDDKNNHKGNKNNNNDTRDNQTKIMNENDKYTHFNNLVANPQKNGDQCSNNLHKKEDQNESSLKEQCISDDNKHLTTTNKKKITIKHKTSNENNLNKEEMNVNQNEIPFNKLSKNINLKNIEYNHLNFEIPKQNEYKTNNQHFNFRKWTNDEIKKKLEKYENMTEEEHNANSMKYGKYVLFEMKFEHQQKEWKDIFIDLKCQRISDFCKSNLPRSVWCKLKSIYKKLIKLDFNYINFNLSKHEMDYDVTEIVYNLQFMHEYYDKIMGEIDKVIKGFMVMGFEQMDLCAELMRISLAINIDCDIIPDYAWIHIVKHMKNRWIIITDEANQETDKNKYNDKTNSNPINYVEETENKCNETKLNGKNNEKNKPSKKRKRQVDDNDQLNNKKQKLIKNNDQNEYQNKLTNKEYKNGRKRRRRKRKLQNIDDEKEEKKDMLNDTN